MTAMKRINLDTQQRWPPVWWDPDSCFLIISLDVAPNTPWTSWEIIKTFWFRLRTTYFLWRQWFESPRWNNNCPWNGLCMWSARILCKKSKDNVPTCLHAVVRVTKTPEKTHSFMVICLCSDGIQCNLWRVFLSSFMWLKKCGFDKIRNDFPLEEKQAI